VAYHPSASDRLIDSDFFPDEPDAREAAQLLALAHAEWERGKDERMSQMFLDPAWDAECERRAV
jgi:hypothetical protein